MPSNDDISHLLRRTEFVARPERVAALTAMASLDQAVDDVLAVPADPGTVMFVSADDSQRVAQLTDFWLDRMAHDSPRPMQEKMALFWHGHFCSSDAKVGSIELMRRQIDLFRAHGLGNLRDLAIDMSTQVAMLRYLDNNQNLASSRNENFGLRLMELFLLGVGNYTEADVQACAAAWTGHTDVYATLSHVFRGDWHDYSTKDYLGRTINAGADGSGHGAETIETMLGDGIVPAGAANVANRGRPTREVAAEFISRKLWTFFAGTAAGDSVVGDLRDAALDNDFELRPWLKALLTHPDFYSPAVKQGLVRSPADYVVALLVAAGLRSAQGTPWWLMEGMGQRLLFPPDVSGWKHNGYWINASAFSLRGSAARHVTYYVLGTYWDGDGLIRLGAGTISLAEVQASIPADRPALVTRFADAMQIQLGSATRAALDEFATNAEWYELTDLVSLLFVSPEMNLA